MQDDRIYSVKNRIWCLKIRVKKQNMKEHHLLKYFHKQDIWLNQLGSPGETIKLPFYCEIKFMKIHADKEHKKTMRFLS